MKEGGGLKVENLFFVDIPLGIMNQRKELLSVISNTIY
jgi:hypothetical protein